jgi:hypothetical protein
MFKLSMRFIANAYEILRNGGIALKRTVLRLLFAAPLPFNRRQGVRTGEITFPFKALRFVETPESKMVPQKGLEPPTPSLRLTCSTSQPCSRHRQIFHVAEMLQNAKSRPRGGLLLSCYLREILAPAVGIEPTTN